MRIRVQKLISLLVIFGALCLNTSPVLSQNNGERITTDSLFKFYKNALQTKAKKNYSEAYDKFQNVIRFSKELGVDSIQFLALGELGDLCIQYGKNDVCLESFMAQYQLAESLNSSPHWIVMATNNVGRGYYYIGKKQKALNYFIIAEKIASEIQDEKLGVILSNIGSIYLETDRPDSAEKFLNQAVIVLEKDKNYKQLATTYAVLGQYWMAIMHQPKLAYPNCVKSVEAADKSGDTRRMVFAYSRMGLYYMNFKKFDSALLWNNKAHKINQSIVRSKDLERMLLAGRAKIYSRMNPQDSVFYLMKRSSAMADSIYRSKSSKNLAEMEVKYETIKKEQELESVKSEILLVNLEVTKRNSQIGFLIAGLLLILSAGGWYFYRIKQKQKLKLAEVRIAEQKKSIKAIIEAQENERQVIAKDLHDGVGQTLSALKMGLVKLSSDENTSELTQTKITQSAQIADAAYGELRTISHRMMPATLKEFGLANAIDQLLRRCFGNLDIKCNFNQTIGNKRFQKEIEIGLFRVCQELVNNIIKHAHCTEVGVQLYQSKQNLILMVEDNGIGFDESKSSDGIGLQNIKSRIEAIDGTITYQTSPNEGTLVIIKKSLQL